MAASNEAATALGRRGSEAPPRSARMMSARQRAQHALLQMAKREESPQNLYKNRTPEKNPYLHSTNSSRSCVA